VLDGRLEEGLAVGVVAGLLGAPRLLRPLVRLHGVTDSPTEGDGRCAVALRRLRAHLVFARGPRLGVAGLRRPAVATMGGRLDETSAGAGGGASLTPLWFVQRFGFRLCQVGHQD